MMEYNQQLKMFKDIVPIGIISVPEIVELLKQRLDIAEITLDEFPGPIVDVAKFNASNCIFNTGLQLKPEEMSFRAFRVIKNEKSAHYDISYQISCQEDECIYIIFEENSGYFLTNSNWLLIELELARGVSEQEIVSEDIQFRSLLSHLAIALEEGYTIACWRD